MPIEKWLHWKPIENLAPEYLIESTIKTEELLEIILALDNSFNNEIKNKYQQKMRIVFQQHFFYRKVDKYCTINDLFNVRKNYGDEFVTQTTLFQIVNSRYIQWLKKESTNAIQNLSLKHFVIIDINNRIDVITAKNPLVEWVENVT